MIESTIWYRQQHLIAPMDFVMFPFFGNKTLRLSSIPQICLMRCIRINWRRETRRREEDCHCHHRYQHQSSADCWFNRPLSPPTQTLLLFELYTRPTVCGVVADAFVFSFVQTAVVLWSAPLAFWFGNCTFEFSCTFLVLTKVKVRLDSLLNK